MGSPPLRETKEAQQQQQHQQHLCREATGTVAAQRHREESEEGEQSRGEKKRNLLASSFIITDFPKANRPVFGVSTKC